jgi:hypothetical protein
MNREYKILCLIILIIIFFTSQAAFAGIKDKISDSLGAAISNPVGAAKIAAKSMLVESAIALGHPVFASQLSKTNIEQSIGDFGTKAVVFTGQNFSASVSQNINATIQKINSLNIAQTVLGYLGNGLSSLDQTLRHGYRIDKRNPDLPPRQPINTSGKNMNMSNIGDVNSLVHTMALADR